MVDWPEGYSPDYDVSSCECCGLSYIGVCPDCENCDDCAARDAAAAAEAQFEGLPKAIALRALEMARALVERWP